MPTNDALLAKFRSLTQQVGQSILDAGPGGRRRSAVSERDLANLIRTTERTRLRLQDRGIQAAWPELPNLPSTIDPDLFTRLTGQELTRLHQGRAAGRIGGVPGANQRRQGHQGPLGPMPGINTADHSQVPANGDGSGLGGLLSNPLVLIGGLLLLGGT